MLKARTGTRAAAVLALGMLSLAAVAMQPGAGGGGGAPGQPAGQPEGQPRRSGPGGPGGEGRQASLEGSMKGMGRALKALQAQITDKAKKAETLKLINSMQVACVSAKGAEPDPVKKAKTDEERAAESKKFRTPMLALARKLLDMEEHVLNDQFDAAKADLDAALKMREEGHKTYNVKD